MSKKLSAAELHAQLESESQAAESKKLKETTLELKKYKEQVRTKAQENEDLATVVKVLERELKDANAVVEKMREEALSGVSASVGTSMMNATLGTGVGQTAAMLAAEKVRAKKESDLWGPVKQAAVLEEISGLKSKVIEKDSHIGDLNDHISQLRRVCEQMADGIRLEREDNMTLQEDIEHLNKVFADIAADETSASNILRQKQREVDQHLDDIDTLIMENDSLKDRLAEAEADNEIMAEGMIEANDQLLLFQQSQELDLQTITSLQEQVENMKLRNASLELEVKPDERIMAMVSSKVVKFQELLTAKDAELLVVQHQADKWRQEAERLRERNAYLESQVGSPVKADPGPASSSPLVPGLQGGNSGSNKQAIPSDKWAVKRNEAVL